MSAAKSALFRLKWVVSARNRTSSSLIHASQSMESSSSSRNDRVYKELGFYSLKKKIEDAINQADMLTSLALELEETRRIKQEEMLRSCNLWDDIPRADEYLNSLGDAIKAVNDLKDMRYKAEEAKLITELAEMDVINHQLFIQAYKASIDVSNFLHCYEMSKLLSGPYDREGACLIIKAGPEGVTSELWAEKLLKMYLRWAEKHHCNGTVIERHPANRAGIMSATIELESEYAYGYLAGERGVHRIISCSQEGSIGSKTHSASVDVIPLFLKGGLDLQIDERDLEISSLSSHTGEQSGCRAEHTVLIHHIPSGTTAQSSGERSYFANKIKALNRLKAKLLVAATEQGLSEISRIKSGASMNELKKDTRRYIFHPNKLVQDVKYGIQVTDLNSILNGNIEPLIRARISHKHGSEMVTELHQ